MIPELTLPRPRGWPSHPIYPPADAKLRACLMNVGRRKLLQSLSAELARTPEGSHRAPEIYANARPRYHAVSTCALDKLFEWRGG